VLDTVEPSSCTELYMQDNRPLKKLGVHWRVILEWILNEQTVDWLHVAQNRAQWRGFVTVNLRVSKEKKFIT